MYNVSKKRVLAGKKIYIYIICVYTGIVNRHARASNIPERATHTQRFGSSHSDQHELGNFAPVDYSTIGQPYTVPRAYSLAYSAL